MVTVKLMIRLQRKLLFVCQVGGVYKTIKLNYATAVSSRNLVFQQFVPVETREEQVKAVKEAELWEYRKNTQ